MHLIHNPFLVSDGLTSLIRLHLETTKTVRGTLSWGVQDYPMRLGLHRWDYIILPGSLQELGEKFSINNDPILHFDFFCAYQAGTLHFEKHERLIGSEFYQINLWSTRRMMFNDSNLPLTVEMSKLSANMLCA